MQEKTEAVTTALFFGSFDPIHTGHAIVVNYVAQSGVCDELWLLPSRVNPLKVKTPPASDIHRLEMCRLVAQNCRNVQVNDVEFSLPAPSYTWHTLCHLRERFPERKFRLLIGSDNWLCFDRWKCHEDIVREFDPIIYPRPGYEMSPEKLPANVTLLSAAPQSLLSSTFIRESLSAGKDLHFFLPDNVLEYIILHNIYG